MRSISINAPAKVNLSLRVLGKRTDGFHEVDLIMTKVLDLFDVISIQQSDQFCFECDDSFLMIDESNLVVKATRLFEKIAQIKCTGKITLKKKIPYGAGLGGGSSNAAATLRAWNQWYDNLIPEEILAKKSAILGSDVPFFFGSNAARCTGRGEIIDFIKPREKINIVLLKPAFPVSTIDAYQKWDFLKNASTIDFDDENFSLKCMKNDLELPVFKKHPFLAEMKSWLNMRSEVQIAMMTGSGSCMLMVMNHKANSEKLISDAKTKLDQTLWSWNGEIEF
jgi:4-diphosphocytidyl-2-C-methyl-D-erythritol kinase